MYDLRLKPFHVSKGQHAIFISPSPQGKPIRRLTEEIRVPKQIDLLLLTQGLPDHAHPASLNLLDRSMPAIGSYGAGKILEKLAFSHTTSLKPGQTKNIDEIFIEATAGAPVPGLENRYIVTSRNFSFYIEPHGFLDKKNKDKI